MLIPLDFSLTQCRLTGVSGSPYADANSQALQTIYISPVNDAGLVMSGYSTIGFACFAAFEQAPNNSTIYPNDVSVMGTLLM